MKIEKITVFGAGVLGTQIAYHTAFHGFDVTINDLSEELLEQARTRFRELAENYKLNLNASQEQNDAALARLAYSKDITEAVGNADLVIEAISENVQMKKNFFKKLGKVAPGKTIFATNSSTLLPDLFSQETGRPEKCLALRFTNPVWEQKLLELIPEPKTKSHVLNSVAKFVKSIGKKVHQLNREQ